jgi:hypothetical protein
MFGVPALAGGVCLTEMILNKPETYYQAAFDRQPGLHTFVVIYL